ncbi:hypothetical protein N1851_030971 [Merluccius polli]|uniref:Tyr recombinase domain-containing protein n=1 Tax=Merluccius polli TaxID=89951 RepID=A0AA47M4K5_MERPO|nr:hypothetical protein N1851_030971 [Merluccius polli]
MSDRYRTDPTFRYKQKENMSDRSSFSEQTENVNENTLCIQPELQAKENAKISLNLRYHNDPEFRRRCIQRAGQKRITKLATNAAFCIHHKIQKALRIRRKYRHIVTHHQEPPQPLMDPVMEAAIASWRVFEDWCDSRHVVPYQCSVVDLLCFLQGLLEKGKAFSTIKVYLAAISACHVGFGDRPAGQHPLVCRFMKGARRKLPVSRPLVPLWDLSVVLEALSHHPLEPLEAVGMKFVSLKVVLLLALTTAKRVSDLQALSIHPSCLQFAPGISKVCLRPNPVFVPKVVESTYRCRTVELSAFHPPPFSSAEEQRLNTLCPVRALHVYVSRSAAFRKGDQLFVSWATPHRGKPLSRQRLSHWIVEAISLAYGCRGLQPPLGLKAHSTRGMATSWALFRGVSVRDICAAACWATPHTFVRFYRLDVSGPSVSEAVLETISPDSDKHRYSPSQYREDITASFRETIRHGPTYVCTVCNRTMFPNQVKLCKHNKMAAACLTGNYVHFCDDDCASHCSVPQERLQEWICHTCDNHLSRGRMPSTAVANNLELAPIPPGLAKLNVLERQLIAKILPFAKIIALPKGQQRAVYGAVMETVVNSLPRPNTEAQLLQVKLKRHIKYKGHQHFYTVNMKNVLAGLAKLKQLHSEYKNVSIDDSATYESLQDDESADEEDSQHNTAVAVQPEQHSTPEQHSDTEENMETDIDLEEVFNSQNEPDQSNPPDIAQEILSYGDGIFSIAPAQGNKPVGFFTIPKLEAMAFPVQFPTGQNTLDEARTIKLLSQRSMSIQMRKGKSKSKDGRRVNNLMLLDKEELERLIMDKDATRFMQPLRGTPSLVTSLSYYISFVQSLATHH